MKKRIFILLILILCAGCQAEYNITINDDLTVDEVVLATEGSEFFKEYEKSSMGRVVGFILEPYLDELNNKKYNVDNYITTNRGGVTINKHYDSLEDFSNNTIFASQYGDKINYNKDGNKITLSINGKFSKAEQDQTRFPIDNAVITINVPYKVIETNADQVNNNLYTWNFNSDDVADREIKLVFDYSKKRKSVNYIFIIISISIIILLIALLLLYNNMKKKRESVNEI